MGRTFVNVTWSDASEVYDGTQQMNHFLRSGRANIKLYEDKPVEKKSKKVKAPDFRTKEEVAEDRLDAKRSKFERAFEDGFIDFERYSMLLTEWEAARARLDRRMNVAEEIIISERSSPLSVLSVENAAVSFSAKHPFATLVGVIVLGSMIMNVFGFGA